MSAAPDGEVPSLDAAPLNYIGHLLRRAQQVHAAAWHRDVSTEVTSVQFAALAVLERQPGSSQADLGAALDLDRSTIADLVHRMTGRGLLTRTADPRDRRRILLETTASGRAELTRIRPRVEALEPVIAGGLTDAERAELHRMLRTLLAAAGEAGLLSGRW